MAEIWKRALQLDELGMDGQFLELGGDSLLAVRVVVAVREALGVELSLRDVFDDGTVERLSSRIDRGGGTAPPGALPGLPPAQRHRRSVPVTKTQAQTCLISEMAEEALPYQFQACIAFHGRLDVETLVEALNGVVARHELLRTRFVRRKGGWRQIVVPELRVPVQVVDVSTADRPSMELQRIVDELVSERIAIGTLPLVRWRIVRLADDHHVLVHVEHHLVHDGWSWSVFLRDLAADYSARIDASMRTPAPLECQFRDFSKWQAGIGASEAGQAQLAYWKERLRDQGPPLLLPSDRPRPRRMSYRGSRILFTVPDDLADRLRAQSRDLGATLFMSMLTAFYVLLHRYSDQEDIVVGSGVANRRLPPFENLIGMLLNTVALRADLSGDPTVDELLSQVRQSSLDAFDHQDLPFEDVLEAVRPARQAGTAPLYQVLFSFQDPPVVDLDLPGVTVVPDDTVGNGSAKADLNVVVVNRRADSGSLSIVWEYSSDLFDESTAQAMLDSYLELLEVLFGDPSARLSEVPMLSREQRDVVMMLAGSTSTYERESAIAQVFEARVAEDPQAPALAWEGGSATYEELNRGANRLAHRLADFGVGPGTNVAVAMERSAAMVEVLLGILKAGAAYVALDTSQPTSRLQAVIDDARPAVICTTSAVQTELPVSDAPVFVVDAEALDTQPETNPPCGVAALDPAYVAYTSGTSGVPKGVAVPQRAVVRLVRGTDYASFDRSETFLLFAPVAFDASTFEIWGPLLNGARLAVAPSGPVGPDELAQVVDRLGVTTLWLTAGLFHQVVEHAPATFSRLRQLLAGGDVLAPEAVAGTLRVLSAGAVLVNGYGPTEGTTFTCCHRMEAGSPVEGAVPIGKPIANTRVYITDRGGALVPRGVPGELVIGGDGLALGYLGDPALDGDPFRPRSLRTGPRRPSVPVGRPGAVASGRDDRVLGENRPPGQGAGFPYRARGGRAGPGGASGRPRGARGAPGRPRRPEVARLRDAVARRRHRGTCPRGASPAARAVRASLGHHLSRHPSVERERKTGAERAAAAAAVGPVVDTSRRFGNRRRAGAAIARDMARRPRGAGAGSGGRFFRFGGALPPGRESLCPDRARHRGATSALHYLRGADGARAREGSAVQRLGRPGPTTCLPHRHRIEVPALLRHRGRRQQRRLRRIGPATRNGPAVLRPPAAGDGRPARHRCRGHEARSALCERHPGDPGTRAVHLGGPMLRNPRGIRDDPHPRGGGRACVAAHRPRFGGTALEATRAGQRDGLRRSHEPGLLSARRCALAGRHVLRPGCVRRLRRLAS